MTNAQDIVNNTTKTTRIKTVPATSPAPNPDTGHLHFHKIVNRNANGGLYQCGCGDMKQIDFAMGH